MSETKTTSSNSVGFSGLLTLIFITLKLTGVINWSWWWVLAPAWGSLLFFIALVLLVVGCSAVSSFFKK